MPNDDFTNRVSHAACAAWTVVLVGFGIVLLSWLGYLAMSAGWLDGLIESGLYGPVTREELVPIWFVFIAAFKLLVFCFALGALFLTLWARGLRKE